MALDYPCRSERRSKRDYRWDRCSYALGRVSRWSLSGRGGKDAGSNAVDVEPEIAYTNFSPPTIDDPHALSEALNAIDRVTVFALDGRREGERG